MTISIICIVVILAVWFISDMTNKNQEIKEQGGMEIKYYTIIRSLTNFPNSKIQKVGKDYILFGLKENYYSVLFDLTETVSGTVEIKYESTNPVFGQVRHEWVFRKETDQQIILKKIETDLEKISSKYTNE